MAATVSVDDTTIVSTNQVTRKMVRDVKVPTLLTEGTKLPVYGTTGAACFDLQSRIDFSLPANTPTIIPTGLAMEIPPNMALLICSRSSLPLKNQVEVANAPGIIDSDYRGEIGVILVNRGTESYQIRAGDRIAQGLMMKIPKFRLIQVTELAPTVRGGGGYGSTGK